MAYVKQISMTPEDAEIINTAAKKFDIGISRLMVEATMDYIKRKEEENK